MADQFDVDDDTEEPETEQPQTADSPLQSPHGTQFEQEHLQTHQKLIGWIDKPNIAVDLGDELLGEIGQAVLREYDIDDNSRSDWKEKSKKAMDLAMQVAETKNYPWPKASAVIYPLMTNAAIQFAARAYPAIVSGKEVVKGVVVGPDDGVPIIDPRTQQPVPNPQTGGPAWVEPPGAKLIRAGKI